MAGIPAFSIAPLPTLPILLLLAFSSVASADPPIPVTECGTVVPAGARAILLRDLDCSSGPRGFELHNDATLDLNGHRVSNANDVLVLYPFNSDGSLCVGSCRWTIHGPGEVSRSVDDRYSPFDTFDCIDVRGGGGFGGGGVLTISEVAVRNCKHYGIRAAADVRARRVTIDGVKTGGVSARSLSAQYVTVDGSGLHAYESMRLRNVAVRNTDAVAGSAAIQARQLSGDRVEVTQSSGDGVRTTGRTYLSRSVISDNTGVGIATTGSLTLSGSIVVDNGSVDIAAATSPTVRRSWCGRSADIDDPAVSFGVCAHDP